MPLSDIQATIITRTKQDEICDSLHDAQVATTEDQLIKAGIQFTVYTYQQGIVDDALLADFTESVLNDNGIYTTGTFTITNPQSEIFILKTASVTINVDSNAGYNVAAYTKISVMGNAVLTLNASGTSYTKVDCYDNSNTTVNITDAAMVEIKTKENAVAVINQYNDSICQLQTVNYSNVTQTGNDSSYCIAKLFGQSVLSYTSNDTSQIKISKNEASTVNAPFLP